VAIEHLITQSADYYTRKFEEHGATPAGVDWNSVASQQRRFRELLRIAEPREGSRYSLLDYGCGFGALAGFVREQGLPVDYRGFDVSTPMIDHARRTYEGFPFSADEHALESADYVIASGVFNVKLDAGEETWRDYTLAGLDRLDALSLAGFAFNMLTSYSDAERKRADLYYADPADYFDYCKQRYARNVGLLHDYQLYEFTILVRKELD
jgi:SAM-dependent methyltransferase